MSRRVKVNETRVNTNDAHTAHLVAASVNSSPVSISIDGKSLVLNLSVKIIKLIMYLLCAVCLHSNKSLNTKCRYAHMLLLLLLS
jgi:hypothetical protein